MADQTQAPPAEAPAEASEPKRPGKMVVLGAVGGGVVLGAVAGLLLVGPMVAKAAGVAPIATADSTAPGDEKGEHGGEGEGKGEGPKSTMHEIDNLVLNPAGSGGTRFLICSVAIELNDEALAEVLTSRDAEVRDAILSVLGVKTVEELSDMTQRETVKKEMTVALNTLFKKKDAIRRLYFPQFVIQ